MSSAVLRGATWILRVVLIAAVALLALSTVATRLAPVLGGEVFVIRGASMTPTIQLGSVIVATRTAAAEIEPGDVVTFRGSNGVVVTHRVIETVVNDGEHLFRTQGDANASPDAFLVPEGALVGVVRASLPLAGYLMAMMAQPSGLISLMAGLAACYVALSIVEEPAVRRDRVATALRIGHEPAA